VDASSIHPARPGGAHFSILEVEICGEMGGWDMKVGFNLDGSFLKGPFRSYVNTFM
jgi:hypothetical protein